jgi:hypothetical protein
MTKKPNFWDTKAGHDLAMILIVLGVLAFGLMLLLLLGWVFRR